MPPMPPETTSLPRSDPPKALVGRGRESFECPLHDSLAADVDPRSGGHLAVHDEAQPLQAIELLIIRPMPHQVRIRDQNARRFRMRAKNAHRLSGLHQQCFVIFELAQRPDNGMERRPIARGAARAAVDDQLVGFLGDLGIEIVHQHPQRGFLMPTLAGNLAPTRRANNRAHS